MAFGRHIIILALILAITSTADAQDALSQDRRAFADGLMSRGLFRLALPEYEMLAAAKPPAEELDMVLYRLAECQRQVGKNDAAAATCARLLKEFPASPARFRAALVRGLILMSSGKPTEAADVLDEIAVEPTAEVELRATAMYHAAEAREAAGRTEAAIVRYTGLTQLSARNPNQKFTAELAAYASLRIASLKALAGTKEANNDALAHFKIIAEAPFSPRIGAEALYLSATLSYNTKRFDDAVAIFRTLAQKYPDDFRVKDSILTAAWANYRVGRYADAVALLNTGDPHVETNAEVLYLCANCNAQLGDRKGAVEKYDTLLKLPGTTPAIRDAAVMERLIVLFKDGAYQQVLSDAAQITDPPKDSVAEFYWLQAEASEALKDNARAIQFYRMLIAKAPASVLAPDASYRLADGLQQKQSWLEASRVYLSIVSSYPTNTLVPQALFASGFCLSQAGQSAQAIRDWHQLITKYPGHETISEALYQKAIEELRISAPRSAAESLDSLIAGYPTCKRVNEAKFWRAHIYYDAKEFGLAEKLLKESLSGNPSTEIAREANFLLGLTYQASSRDAEAAACFQPLLDAPIRAKFTPDRLAWLSEFQYNRGNFAAARDAANELIVRDDTSDDWMQAANTLAGRAYTALSDTNSAIAKFRLAADSPSRTRYAAESALRLAELLFAILPANTASNTNAISEVNRYFNQAAQCASTPELLGIRANAYFGLASCAEKIADIDSAVRYYMSVAILFDDEKLVAKALSRAADILRTAGRDAEADAAIDELRQRYPVKK